jgi:hypothetical protein
MLKIFPKQNSDSLKLTFESNGSAIKSKIILLNLRGSKFEVSLVNFQKLPESRLGRLKIYLDTNKIEYLNEICDCFDLSNMEFYFNKDPSVFHMILEYYSGEKIHLDENICASYFHKQLNYWGLDELHCFDDCCQYKYLEKLDRIRDDLACQKKIINTYEYREDFSKSLFPLFREKAWAITENPKSSKYAIVSKFFFLLCS